MQYNNTIQCNMKSSPTPTSTETQAQRRVKLKTLNSLRIGIQCLKLPTDGRLYQEAKEGKQS